MTPDDPLAVSLQWLAASHGVTTSRDAIVDGLALVDGRLSPSLFAEAAQRVGLVARVARQPLGRLNQLLLPCVVLLRDNRACVLRRLDFESGQAEVLLPELGMEAQPLTLEELHASYSGLLIYCRPAFRTQSGDLITEIEDDTRGHWFWSVIRANRPVYRDVLVAALFINLFALVMPLFVMNVYDRVVPNRATDTLWVLALGAVIVICADLALRLLRAWFVELAASRADIKLSARIMQRILGMRLEHRPASVGSFAANVQSFESVRSFVGSMTVTALIDLPFFLLFALIITLIAWPMVIPVLVGAALIVLYALSVQARMRHLSGTMSQAGAQRNAALIESLANLETLKSFNATSRMQSAWEQTTRFLSACAGKQRLLGMSVGALASWIQQLVAVSMILIGVYLIINGQISQGALIAAYMLSSRAMAPIAQTASLLTQYYQAATALESSEQLMGTAQERKPDRHFISRPRLRGEIELRNVSFSYPDEQRSALEGVSLHIRAGERVGILGPVGSGKTTLEKLILGLYRPTSGQLLIDGVHLEQIDPAELRRGIGYIPQEVQLLSGSVYDNITLGLQQPGSELLQQAIHIAGLKTLVGNHADGLSMPVGERGSRLSGGQRQALAVARAVMADSSILLFDEPTSAMDSTLENHVRKTLKQFSQGRTLLLVTHRASLLELVDRLIVMDAGKMIADGPKHKVLQALEQGSIARAAP